MKIVLGISLILNLILGVLYFQEKNQPPLERIVIEHKPKIIKETVTVTEKVPVPAKSRIKKEGEQIDFDPMVVTDARDYTELVEQMETEKRDYLVNQLNISEDTLKKHDQIRQAYFKDTSEIYQKDPMGEVSLKDKRELLRMEEEYLAKVKTLYGQSKWEKLENYRRQYNKSVMKKVREENAPAILMAP